MPKSVNASFTKTLLITLLMMFPLAVLTQQAPPTLKDLQHEIDQLNEVITRLEADQMRSRTLHHKSTDAGKVFTKHDSLRLKYLNRRQRELRAQIDVLAVEILKISKALQDPNKRYALAKKIQQASPPNQPGSVKKAQDIPPKAGPVSARSIDLAAVNLVRQGKTLDQARLLVIDELSIEQVNTFCHNLPKSDRHDLYDIADDIVAAEGVDLNDARRSAIYFYLFAK